MRLPSTQSPPESPFVKILMISTLVLVVLVAGAWWAGRGQGEAKARELLAVARDDYKAGHYASGLASLRNALKWADLSEARDLEVDLLLALDKDYQAEVALEKLLARHPKEAHYYSLLANIAFQNGDLARAVEQAANACALQPDNSDYAVSRANLLVHHDRLSEAEPYYRALMARDPKFFPAWENYVNALVAAGRRDQALALAREGVARFPDNEDHVFQLAQTLDGAKLTAEAVRYYERFLQIHPMQDSIAAQRILEITGRRVDPKLEAMRVTRVPFRKTGGVMLVRASVNGREGTFLLDTGASMSIVFSRHAARYGLSARAARVTLSTGNGRIHVPIADAVIGLGPYRLVDGRVALSTAPMDLPADGIIGMDVMNHFRFEVDQSQRVVTLTR